MANKKPGGNIDWGAIGNTVVKAGMGTGRLVFNAGKTGAKGLGWYFGALTQRPGFTLVGTAIAAGSLYAASGWAMNGALLDVPKTDTTVRGTIDITEQPYLLSPILRCSGMVGKMEIQLTTDNFGEEASGESTRVTNTFNGSITDSELLGRFQPGGDLHNYDGRIRAVVSEKHFHESDFWPCPRDTRMVITDIEKLGERGNRDGRGPTPAPEILEQGGPS